jgi:hypothetical protein
MMDDVQFILPTTAQQPGKLPIRFYMTIKANEAKSKEAGRPICEEIEMYEIRIPGVAKDVHVGKVTQKTIDEYPAEYKHWKATQTQLVAGTPLKECPRIMNTRAMELNMMGVLSCEQLVSLTDAQIQNCGMDTRKLIAEVKAWMDAAKDSALVMKQAAELQLRDDRIADLQRQIAELAERFGSMDKPRTPRRANSQ